MKTKYPSFIAACCLLLIISSGCSINTLVANALTGDGSTAVFTGDSDPQLVGDAIPFAIKMYEALLDGNPGHQGLMLTTGSMFVMYANAFVHGPAERLPSEEWQAREEGLMRAKRLYLRGITILYDALDAKYRGFRDAAGQEDTFQAYLGRVKKEDVDLLYWAVAGGLAAYSIDILDFELSMRMPEWTAMILRAYELDPDFNGTALDEFLLLFYASLPFELGGDIERAKYHFRQAQDKTGGNNAGAYISYAKVISTHERDYATFRDYLERALAVDPDADIATRLVTIINQREARWLLDNAGNFFSSVDLPDDYY
ncbi:MAG: TRAP transporter TatT component family protein [Treponema sp.]|nr:TRAP transporter TatT component family protein [Treponema sp.]